MENLPTSLLLKNLPTSSLIKNLPTSSLLADLPTPSAPEPLSTQILNTQPLSAQVINVQSPSDRAAQAKDRRKARLKRAAERIHPASTNEQVREMERHRFDQWCLKRTQQYQAKAQQLLSTDASTTSAHVLQSAISSSSQSVTIPNKLNLGIVDTSEDSEGISLSHTSSSQSKPKKHRRRHRRAHETNMRKLDEA